MNKVFRWTVIHNATGLTGFLTTWAVGGPYWIISILGFVSPVDNWIMVKVLVSFSGGVFIFFPTWNFLFGKTFQ